MAITSVPLLRLPDQATASLILKAAKDKNFASSQTLENQGHAAILFITPGQSCASLQAFPGNCRER